MLPGILFVAGFALAVPALINVPIYQFLFICYWFWANLMSPKIGIPSIVGTMLNAAGPWAQEAFFRLQWTFLILHASVMQGVASIVLLAGLGVLAVAFLWACLRWHHTHR